MIRYEVEEIHCFVTVFLFFLVKIQDAIVRACNV